MSERQNQDQQQVGIDERRATVTPGAITDIAGVAGSPVPPGAITDIAGGGGGGPVTPGSITDIEATPPNTISNAGGMPPPGTIFNTGSGVEEGSDLPRGRS